MTPEEAKQNLNKLRGFSPTYDEALDILFPELAESEDEKIRKELIGMINECTNWTHKKEYIAYLEKQKEQKLTAEEVLIKAGLKPYRDGNQWCILAGNNIQEGICGFGDTIEDALYQFLLEILEIQSEHKPRKFKLGDKVHWRNNDTNVLTITGFQDGAYLTDSEYGPIPFYDENNWERVEQKPAELSEEDEEMLRDILDSLCAYQVGIRGDGYQDTGLLTQVEKEKQWIKTLLERLNHQLKPRVE